MAERRMFAKTIVDSDAFLDMPTSAQALYFHLCIRADDDGFVNNPKKIRLFVRASDDDLKLLFVKKFVIPFDSGVVVIKHWKIHNYIAKDRYTETKYKVEKSMLQYDENNAYQLPENIENSTMYTTCIQNVDTGKDRLGKDRLNIYSAVIDYLNLKTNSKYQSTTESTRRLIRARQNENATLEDFKTVIDKKVAEWKGTEQEKFLRPETLFGTKFESYLNQKIVAKKTGNVFFDLLKEEMDDTNGSNPTFGQNFGSLPEPSE